MVKNAQKIRKLQCTTDNAFYALKCKCGKLKEMTKSEQRERE